MIRLFTALCKSLFDSLTDETIFLKATEDFSHHASECPNCAAIGKLVPYGKYSRSLTSYEDGSIKDRRICPFQLKCKSCKKTHAILPDILIPYSPYSLRFMLTVLIAYFERETTVVAICEHFCIAVSTLYAWKQCLLEHKELMIGVLLSKKEPALAFLKGLFESMALSDRIQDFFQRYAFSFLQHQSIMKTCSRPP